MKNASRRFWTTIGSVALYGIALGLLLTAFQFMRYRMIVLNHAQEFYLGLIALLFMIVGIWAGRRLTGKSDPPAPPTPAADASPELEKLGITPREYEVLQLMAQGLSNQEIAGRLFVSLNTVKTHISNVFSKLDAQRRTQAIQRAKEIGLLP